MAQAAANIARFDLTDFRLLCNAACQQNPVEFKNTEVVASILLDNINLMAGDTVQRAAAHAILNAHMENFQDVMDEQEELDERIAYGMSVPHKDTNDGNDNYEPVLSGRSPLVTDAVAARAAAAAVAAAAADDDDDDDDDGDDAAASPPPASAVAAPTAAVAAATQYTTLITFVNQLKTPEILAFLYDEMNRMNQSLIVLCGVQAQVYSNILFFSTGGGGIQDTSLFPKYSFNILCKKQSFLLPQLLVLGVRGVGSILNFHVCNIVGRLGVQGDIRFKIVNPTETNKLWQVKICLFGNEFTFISIQVISMSNTFFNLGFNPVAQDVELCEISNLCFSLYNKCLSKDFNCLCSLSELDTALFRSVTTLPRFQAFVRAFLDNFIETLPNVKKQYFIMGLYNLDFCVSTGLNYTPETKAYELLFDRNPVGIDLFNKSMCFIKGLNQQDYAGFPEQIRFAMGGGKLYSIFHKKLKELCNLNEIHGEDLAISQARITLAQILIPNVSPSMLSEFIKAAADADFGCFYPEPQEGIAAGGIGASSCMAICMLLQLSLKQLIDTLFAAAAEQWGDYEIDIGNSCIGTPPTTLSSLRIVLKNIKRFYTLNPQQNAVLQPYRQYLGDIANIKATISPYDFVMKGSMKSYIVHIFEAVHSYMDTGIDPATFPAIADFLTKYCMVTLEGFSSPIKGILDIFYTLFIIQNFANRTFVTQKINKELKRVAICAQILFLHYTELGQNVITQQILPILTAMIGYGYDGSNLLGIQFGAIMTTYVQFVNNLCNIYLTNNVNYLYFSVAGVAIPNVVRPLTIIETSFMNLLTECEENVLSLSVFTRTIDQYTPVITALATMGPISRETGQPTAQATTALYQNKLYASCRDAENKKEGVVAIMSAYQEFLWDKRKIDKIRRSQEGDDCLRVVTDYKGIVQCLQEDAPTVFDALSGIISTIVQDVNLDLGAGNTVDNYTFTDDNARKLFLVFSWFITSVFGVKTKSKNTKVISMGRTYLQLLRETHPVVSPVNLFGSQITIEAPAPVAAVHAAIDKQIVQEIPDGTRVAIATDNERGRLCLAYSSERIFGMAINKYIKMDIDMIVHDICDTFTNFVSVNLGHGTDANGYSRAFITANAKYYAGLFAEHAKQVHDFPDKFLGFAKSYTIAYSNNNSVEEARKASSAHFKEVFEPSCRLFVTGFALQHVKQVQPPQPAGEQPQPQEQRVMVYPLSVETASPVFNQEIFTQLIANLSRVSSGKGNKENAALYMRTIMRRICFCLDTNQISIINKSIQQIQNFYPYNFDLHNLTKFENLTKTLKKQWYDHLMSKILNREHSPEVIFNNMRLLVLLYNCIVFGNDEIRYHEKPYNLPSYLDAIGPIIDAKFKECPTGDAGGGLNQLSWSWNRQEPKVAVAVAAADSRAEFRAKTAVVAAAAAAGVTAKQRQEKLNAEVEAKKKAEAKAEAKAEVEAKEKSKSDVKTIGRNPNKPSMQAASQLAAAASAAEALRKNNRKGGGTRNNHTRRNKNKRKKNSNTKSKTKFKPKSSSKYKKVIPSSRSGSQSNRKKSKPKKSQKNVTFKRRRARK